MKPRLYLALASLLFVAALVLINPVGTPRPSDGGEHEGVRSPDEKRFVAGRVVEKPSKSSRRHLQAPGYVSESKLLVRYVLTRPETDIERLDVDRIEAILNEELELLREEATLARAVEAIGPDLILGNNDGSGAPLEAVSLVRENLKMFSRSESNLITLRFRHSEPEVAQQVLQEVVDAYFHRHLEIHRASKGASSASSIEAALDAVLDSGGTPNISIIQKPTEARRVGRGF